MKSDERKRRCQVLIVDDDNDLCHILEVVLGGLCPVHIEHDLRSAEFYLLGKRPDVILLDNNLPDGLGVAYIRHILEIYPDAKIVLMTADASIGLKEKAIHEGAVKFIPKPFRASVINDVILSICPGFKVAS